jgi:hypothetical protein
LHEAVEGPRHRTHTEAITPGERAMGHDEMAKIGLY